MDLRGLRHAYGLGVIPPLVDDDLLSMGRINDSLLYGGISNVTVEGDDAQCAEIVDRVVSAASSAYGRPFIEIYEDAGPGLLRDPHRVALTRRDPPDQPGQRTHLQRRPDQHRGADGLLLRMSSR